MGYFCAALIAGSSNQENKYTVERWCLGMLYIFEGVAAGTSCLFVWHYGTELHILVIQRTGILSQFVSANQRSRNNEEGNKAEMAHLKFSKKRVRLLSQACGLCGLIFTPICFLHGLFVQQIYNSTPLIIISSVVLNLGIPLIVFIIIIQLFISKIRQVWLIRKRSRQNLNKLSNVLIQREEQANSSSPLLIGYTLKHASAEVGIVSDDAVFPYSIADVPLVDMPNDAMCRSPDDIDYFEHSNESVRAGGKSLAHAYSIGSLPLVEVTAEPRCRLGINRNRRRQCHDNNVDPESQLLSLAMDLNTSTLDPRQVLGFSGSNILIDASNEIYTGHSYGDDDDDDAANENADSESINMARGHEISWVQPQPRDKR
ncbi:hypothetical protein BDF19DRAFT_49782 [Syncephalis fuscata]|nr:hypothetical protein BDF19DRAFT_49782 [Syncephalis fuscata]